MPSDGQNLVIAGAGSMAALDAEEFFEAFPDEREQSATVPA